MSTLQACIVHLLNGLDQASDEDRKGLVAASRSIYTEVRIEHSHFWNWPSGYRDHGGFFFRVEPHAGLASFATYARFAKAPKGGP